MKSKKGFIKKYVILNLFQDLISERPCDPEINSGRRKRGFTLSEVLITLGIIGVVAALTIPNLMASYQKQQYGTQLKEVYSQMSQAVKMSEADEGVDKFSDTDLGNYTNDMTQPEMFNNSGNFLKKYFKITKDCAGEFPSTCFADKYTNIYGDTVSSVEGGTDYAYSVITANGASIAILKWSEVPPAVFVDVNGPKKPNVSGRDLFNFSIYYDGSLEDGVWPNDCSSPSGCSAYGGATKQEARENKFSGVCLQTGYGEGCFGKILNDNWKMDY